MGLPSWISWIGERRGNRVGPPDATDFRTFRGIGLVLLACAAAITLFYLVNFDVAAYTVFRGELRTGRGVVTLVEATGWYEPGTRRVRRDARTEIVAVTYSFVDHRGVARVGVSFRPNARPTVGTQVTVEYPVDQPDTSRIRGYRTARYASMPGALGLLAGVGVVFLAVGILGGRRRSRGAGRGS